MRVQLRSRVTGIEKRAGGAVLAEDATLLLAGDADVYRPDGEPLLLLRKQAVPLDVMERAQPIARHIARKYESSNRGKYAGLARASKVFPDGTVSAASWTVDAEGKTVGIASAVVGFFERQGGWHPYCRATAFTGKEPEKWAEVMPMVECVARRFQTDMPDRFAKQAEIASRTPNDYLISGTPFTTLTVNHNIAGRIHRDAGDFKDGFGCLSVMRGGSYKGGLLIFPEYRVGVDMGHGDLLFFNSHDWHGVTDFYDTSPDYERISVVYYFRERMVECLPLAQEMERAKMKGVAG